MALDPPPLGSAYSQAIKYGPVMTPTGSIDAILRAHRAQSRARNGDLEASEDKRRPSAPAAPDTFTTKIFALTSNGYILQYSGEGNCDRMPERIMQLNPGSAAMASDAIPGKHWVLQISETFTEDDGAQTRSRFALPKLGLGALRHTNKNFLLIMDSPDELDAWLVAIRREIQSLGGVDDNPQRSIASTAKEQIEDRFPRRSSSLGASGRPSMTRSVTAPIETPKIRHDSNLMVQRGLFLLMDSDVEDELEEYNNQQPLSSLDIASPHSLLSVSDQSPQLGRQSSETTASYRSNTGRRPSSSTNSPYTNFNTADIEKVIEAIIPYEKSPHKLSPTAFANRRSTGLRKRTTLVKARSTSQLIDPKDFNEQQSLSAGFKRLTPVAVLGPVVLTPPESPQSAMALPDSFVGCDLAETKNAQSTPFVTSPPIDDLVSPPADQDDREGVAIAMRMASARPEIVEVPRSPLSAPPGFYENFGAGSSTSTVNSVGTVPSSVARIPPRQSSLAHIVDPNPKWVGSSDRIPRSVSRMEGEITVKSIQTVSVEVHSAPIANALLLAPSPHPPPTAALPKIPKNKSPAGSRPGSSRGERTRTPSVASARTARPGSASSCRPADAYRPTTPEQTTRPDELPVEQTTPHQAKIQSVVLPPMSRVPATRPEAPLHPHSITPQKLTISERRRRRSPSPVQARARSDSDVENVLSAISEATEATTEIGQSLSRVATTQTVEEEPEKEERENERRSIATDAEQKNLAVPNPLAANPVRSPDMRMIPHHEPKRSDQPPPAPLLPPPPPPKDNVAHKIAEQERSLQWDIPQSTQAPPRPPSVAAMVSELAAGPLSPGPMSPPPTMKASVTDFGNDEFDMWAWPMGASASSDNEPSTGVPEKQTDSGREHQSQKQLHSVNMRELWGEERLAEDISPRSRVPLVAPPPARSAKSYVPLQLDVSLGFTSPEPENSNAANVAQARARGHKPRWSLFNAIDNIQ